MKAEHKSHGEEELALDNGKSLFGDKGYHSVMPDDLDLCFGLLRI